MSLQAHLLSRHGHGPKSSVIALDENFQERKISPKRKFLAGYPYGHPAKNFGQALEVQEKQAFCGGYPAQTSMEKLRSQNGLIFCSLNFGLISLMEKQPTTPPHKNDPPKQKHSLRKSFRSGLCRLSSFFPFLNK